MTSEFLLDAIGRIDDELIVEARRPARRPLLLRSVAAAAAAIVVCVGVLSVPGLFPSRDPAEGEAEAVMDSIENQAHSTTAADGQLFDATATGAGASDSEASKANGNLAAAFVYTEQDTYLLADIRSKVTALPADAISLGQLSANDSAADLTLATTAPDLAGCPVWQSADGRTLYIQSAPDEWLCAYLKE